MPFQIRVVAEDVLSCWNGSGGVEAGQYPADSEEITYTEKTTSTGSTTPTVTFDSNNLLQ